MNTPQFRHFSLTGQTVLPIGEIDRYDRGLAANLAQSVATHLLASHNVTALDEVAREVRVLGQAEHALPLDQALDSSNLGLRDRAQGNFDPLDGGYTAH